MLILVQQEMLQILEISSVSNTTRGIIAGGTEPSVVNKIEYITFATSGNSTDFGDMTSTRTQPSGCSDAHGGLEAYDPRLIPVGSSRGVWAGGYDPSISNVIDYINIASTGNAADFGNLTAAKGQSGTMGGNLTRFVFGGGYTPSKLNVIDSLHIQSLGNAADFGDLTTSRGGTFGFSSSTRGVAGGGFE